MYASVYDIHLFFEYIVSQIPVYDNMAVRVGMLRIVFS